MVSLAVTWNSRSMIYAMTPQVLFHMLRLYTYTINTTIVSTNVFPSQFS